VIAPIDIASKLVTRRVFNAFVVLLLVALVAGCAPNLKPPPIEPMRAGDQAALPTYEQAVAAHNNRLAHFHQLWSVADVKLEWITEKGQHKTEQAEGKFIFRSPFELALTLGKNLPGVGTLFWIGSDEQLYWLFDLNDPGVLYLGSHDAPPIRFEGFPLGVAPAELPCLLGLLPLDALSPGVITSRDGYWLLQTPDSRWRYHLRPTDALPLRIDRLDAAGQPIITSDLSSWLPLRDQQLSRESRPQIASRSRVYLIDEDQPVRVTLKLTRLTADGSKIRDAAFDLDKLMRIHKPAEIIELGAP